MRVDDLFYLEPPRFYQQSWFMYAVAAAISLLFSIIVNAQEVVINSDAICYLGSAETIGKLGLKAAMQLCDQAKWPLYSLLIYGTSKILFVTPTFAAQIINALLSVLSVSAFILIVKELGGTTRVQWLAAGVILLSHEFNSVREYIVRDHGFWAFYLLSIWLVLKYFRRPRGLVALAWNVSLMIATLFRIEGVIFLLAIPCLSWLCFRYSCFQRAKFFFTLYTPIILMGVLISAWLLIHPQQTLQALGRVSEVTNQFQHGFSMMLERYRTTEANLAQHVLTSDSAKEAGMVLFAMLIAWYIVAVWANVSWVYGGLIIYAWWRRAAAWSNTSTLMVAGYIFVNLIITLSFLLEHLFLSKRYLIALSLVLMLYVPFALNDLWERRRDLHNRVMLSIACFFILISALGGILDFGHSKQYIRDAGRWLDHNVPSQASLYSNDYHVMYYSHHFGNAIFQTIRNNWRIETIADDKWQQFDYLALRLGSHDDPAIIAVTKKINTAPIETFSNKRGDRVVIYKIVAVPAD
ncbi:MAG: phospholipid carrier-dependent glycosyltransferase [Gammaproteobacteria bacterium]